MGGNPFRAFNDIYRSMFWTTTIENYYTNSGNLITTPAPADQIGLSCSGYSDSTKVGVRPIIIVK